MAAPKNKTMKKKKSKATPSPYKALPVAQKFGRPSKFTQETMDKAEAYLSWCYDHPRDEYETEYDGDGKAVKVKRTICLPSHQGLAKELRVTASTLYEWGKKSEHFSYILDQLLVLQQLYALENGIAGVWNSNIVKVVLAKHGWRDIQETEHKVDPRLQRALEQIDDILK